MNWAITVKPRPPTYIFTSSARLSVGRTTRMTLPGFMNLPQLDPDIVRGCPLTALVPRVGHPARLDQEQLDLLLRVRLVLDALRNHEHLPRRDVDRAIPEIDPQIALHHNEGLISVLVVVPDEVALQFHNLE